MLQISQLLGRFKNLNNTEKIKKELIIDIFKQNKIPINIQQIKISKNSIFIKTQPIIKTEIILKKETILKQIKEISALININDIK